MSNKGFMVALGTAVTAVITFLAAASDFLPSFIIPFLVVLYPLYILYIMR